jgi:hypothetical protein
MRISTTALMAVLTIGSLSLADNTLACGGYSSYGYNNYCYSQRRVVVQRVYIQPQTVVEAPADEPAAESTESSAPSANIQVAGTSLPSVAVGSSLTLDGQQFGSEQGAVRLRIGELSMPAQVTEWNGTSLKVKLPEMDLTAAVRANIEVFRADGSLASQSAIQLTPAVNHLAMSN